MSNSISNWNSEKIKALRLRHGWSQGDLALRLGCRQQTVSEWELGEYLPANAYSKLLDNLEVQEEIKIPFVQTRKGGLEPIAMNSVERKNSTEIERFTEVAEFKDKVERKAVEGPFIENESLSLNYPKPFDPTVD